MESQGIFGVDARITSPILLYEFTALYGFETYKEATSNLSHTALFEVGRGSAAASRPASSDCIVDTHIDSGLSIIGQICKTPKHGGPNSQS